MQPHRGTTVLVLGIIGIVLCPICAIIAWVMGNKDLSAMAAGQMNPEGEGNTKVGKILGIIGTVLIIIYVILGVLGVVGSIAAAAVSVPPAS